MFFVCYRLTPSDDPIIFILMHLLALRPQFMGRFIG
jgi:hypothetical protein